MAISSIKDIVDAEIEWRTMTYNFRKASTQITWGSIWFDITMSPWNPLPKYWFDAAPWIAKIVAQSTDGGFYHWPNISPLKKYLRSTSHTMVWAGTPMQMILCDYLLYYPSIDESTTDFQPLDNTVTLSRYTDGEWVQVLPINVSWRNGWVNFFVTYTNSDWVSGRTSQTVRLTNNSIGSIAHSDSNTSISAWPFIGLQSWDSWVQKIESVQMLWPDIWLFSLVLVKPLAYTQIFETTAPTERDYFLDMWTCPQIMDDAFLSWLVCPRWNLSGVQQYSEMKIIWN